jgi:Tetracyclin repressor-like, C-terminal domain
MLLQFTPALSLGGAGRPSAGRSQDSCAKLPVWNRQGCFGPDPGTALQAVLIWSRLHGFVSLEIAGKFASMGIDPDQLFSIQLAALTR